MYLMHRYFSLLSIFRINLVLVFILSFGWGCEDSNSPTEKVGGELMGGRAGNESGGSLTQLTDMQSANSVGDLSGEVAGESSGMLSGEQVQTAGTTILPPPSPFPAPPIGYPLFSFPIHIDDRILMKPDPVFGVDHDPSEGIRIRCLDYAGRGFPHCYDEHTGSDFILMGGFDTMDSGSARVVAALAGEVVATDDGNYDRCHADLLSADVTCDGNLMRPNFIKIRHDNGWISAYYHLKSGSVQVRRGQRVECGEFLGLVGSSGYSSAPHLHFEVESSLGAVWDPFAGPESQDFSLWIYQPDLSEMSDSDSSLFPINFCAPRD